MSETGYMADFKPSGAAGTLPFMSDAPPKEHPLFLREDNVAVTSDIQYISFRRRRSDGQVDHCPEDIPADKITSWADVVGPWGGGEYKAIGKDKHHRIVAWSPPEQGEWLLFDQPSKPFTLRDGRRYGREPPLPIPPASSPQPRTAAPPHAAPSAMEALLVAMVNQSAETSRAILSAVLEKRAEPAPRSGPSVLELLRAVREWMPMPTSAAPTSISEQLTTLKTLLELTRPSPPEPSILGELRGLMTTVLQTRVGDARLDRDVGANRASTNAHAPTTACPHSRRRVGQHPSTRSRRGRSACAPCGHRREGRDNRDRTPGTYETGARGLELRT
jgi:hypothetical protein